MVHFALTSDAKVTGFIWPDAVAALQTQLRLASDSFAQKEC